MMDPVAIAQVIDAAIAGDAIQIRVDDGCPWEDNLGGLLNLCAHIGSGGHARVRVPEPKKHFRLIPLEQLPAFFWVRTPNSEESDAVWFLPISLSKEGFLLADAKFHSFQVMRPGDGYLWSSDRELSHTFFQEIG